MNRNEENEVIEEIKTRSTTKGKEKTFSREDAAFVMDTASEALAFLDKNDVCFTGSGDGDDASSLCRIISEYLHFHASLLNGDLVEA